MVEKLKQILEEIIKQKGNVYLFAVLKMDELTDKWTLIIAAPWINESSVKSSFSYIRDTMMACFTDEEMASIARLGLFTKNEHIVEELLKFKAGATINENVKINGNIVHEAYIFASNSDI